MRPKRIILVAGPTASGKSARAMQIARREKGHIINADAMQIYAGLPLLTAQPAPQDKAEIPHLLYEVTDPAHASSVGQWLALAKTAIAQSFEAGAVPIVTGGTGLYFQALLNGLAEIPPVPESVRAAATALYETEGEEKFRNILAQKDSAGAARIARNDRQRLIRAYEVVAHTGKTLQDWQAGAASPPDRDILYEKHLLMPPRDELYAACDARFVNMIEKGAIEEVRTLAARSLSPTLPAMKILGVREIRAHLRGDLTLAAAIDAAQQATRNYAKRQMTWFRNQWKS